MIAPSTPLSNFAPNSRDTRAFIWLRRMGRSGSGGAAAPWMTRIFLALACTLALLAVPAARGQQPETLRHTLTNPSPAASDEFGISVAVSGTRVVVGASSDNTGATDAGS